MQSVPSNSNSAANPYPDVPLTGPTTCATLTQAPADTSKSPPRPENCFLIFRREVAELFKKCSPPEVKIDSKHISRIAGNMWNDMSEKKKMPYRTASQKKLEEHKIAHPGYKLQVRKRKMGKKAKGVSGTAGRMQYLSAPQGPPPPSLPDQYREARQPVYHASSFSPSTSSSSAPPESFSGGNYPYVALSEYYFTPPPTPIYFSHGSSQLHLWEEPHLFTTPLAPHSSDPPSWQPEQIQNVQFTYAQLGEPMGFF